MKDYPKNSPQAMARAVIMMMVADTRIRDREIEALKRIGAFELLGMTEQAFADVLRDYFGDLQQHRVDDDRIALIDRERIDQVVDCIDDPALRRAACQIMLIVAKADGKVSAGESAVFRYVLERWNMTLDELAR